MSREIEFRGKRLDRSGHGKWAYGSLLTMKHSTMVNPMTMEDSIGATYEVDPETVGQYTGLKDKNGVEIYEGDVVLIANKHDVGIGLGSDIRSFDEKFVIVWKDHGFTEKPVGEYRWVSRMGFSSQSIVIGNIYENPELLK